MRKPEFVTFTGVDAHTSVDAMLALSALYPIEWGILFSISRMGVEPRYPDHRAMAPFSFAANRIHLAAHLCGEYTRAIMEDRPAPIPPDDLAYFRRIQFNHHAPDPALIVRYGKQWGPMRCIAQTRDTDNFPTDQSVDWLFDPSGGRGIEQPIFPAPTQVGQLVGYAGGITPENAKSVVQRINSKDRYWIDMESGVRTDDRFDIEKCRAVCEAIYSSADANID